MARFFLAQPGFEPESHVAFVVLRVSAGSGARLKRGSQFWYGPSFKTEALKNGYRIARPMENIPAHRTVVISRNSNVGSASANLLVRTAARARARLFSSSFIDLQANEPSPRANNASTNNRIQETRSAARTQIAVHNEDCTAVQELAYAA